MEEELESREVYQNLTFVRKISEGHFYILYIIFVYIVFSSCFDGHEGSRNVLLAVLS